MAEDPLALYDARWHGFFRRAFTRFGRRHMRALRLARWGQPDPGPPGTVLVVSHDHSLQPLFDRTIALSQINQAGAGHA